MKGAGEPLASARYVPAPWNRMTENEVLKYAVANGMIDLSYVQEKIEMSKRKELLEKHPCKIWEGKNGCWYTYLPDGKGGRSLKKRKSKDDLEKDIIEYQVQKADDPTISDVFQEWIEHRLELKEISKASYDRYYVDFKRFFSDFGKRKVKHVTELDIEDFMLKSIADFSLTAKSFGNLRILVYGIFKRAKKKKIVSFSITEVVNDLEISRNMFCRTKKDERDEVFMQDELPLVLEYLKSNIDIVNLGLLLMFLTGVRVGELVAIKASDVDGNIIHISRTESHYRDMETGKEIFVVKDTPKTAAGVRNVIVPNGYAWILRKIRLLNPAGEFLLMRKDARIKASAVRKRLHNVCKTVGVHDKSTHKARKTYASILLSSGIDSSMVTSLMGHTDISCTEQYYHRDRKDIAEKALALDSIPEFQL